MIDLLALQTRYRRIKYMLLEKGWRYLFNYLWVGAIYNNDFMRDLFLVRWYPRFVFYPKYFELEITTRCDLRCTMCEHTYWKEKPRDLTLEQFKMIVDQFPDLKWLGTTGIGSSFLNKDYLKMLEYAKKKKVYIELFDPCHRLDAGLAEKIVADGLLDRLYISIDGATKETYEKIRVGADFDQVVHNIKYIVDAKRKHKTMFPEISFHFIISKTNYKEVPRMIELVYELTRHDNIGVMFSHLLHPFEEIKGDVFVLPKALKEETHQLSKKHKVRAIWGKNAREEKQPINKCTEWIMPFIFADGSVIPCCAGNEANRRDFQVKHRLGNIFEEPFAAIWNGPKYRNLRDAIHRGYVPIPCQDCPGYETIEVETKNK
ncbi:MAG: radical SAM protein [Candidatus Omnitrophota bacterium]